MRTYLTETIQKNNKIKGIVELVAEIRNRLDDGHYDFMTWDGRSKLREKLSEYENYAREPHKSRLPVIMNLQKQKLNGIEAELRTLLDSTY